VERVLYPVAVHFKGSGFYTTDYGRSRKKEPSKDGAGAESGGEPKKKEEKKKAAEA
jgi:predicted nucleic acid-binding Zn ribbon protein